LKIDEQKYRLFLASIPSMATTRPRKIFLDANVVIRAGKPPAGPLIPRVADLVDAGYVKVVTTDLTKMAFRFICREHAANLARRHQRHLVGTELVAVGERRAGANASDGPEPGPDQRGRLHDYDTNEAAGIAIGYPEVRHHPESAFSGDFFKTIFYSWAVSNAPNWSGGLQWY
jgi:hypothetical protein